jgi:hypothetical protein
MYTHWLIKTAGRTASHQLMSLLERTGHRLHWTEVHRRDQDREAPLRDAVPQAWHCHRREWPNATHPWRVVVMRSRDLHRQAISKIVAQHTGEPLLYSHRTFPPITVTAREFQSHANNIARLEKLWLDTAPPGTVQVFREDLLRDPEGVLSRMGAPVPGQAHLPGRFGVNPRPLHLVCENWSETLTWSLPSRSHMAGLHTER